MPAVHGMGTFDAKNRTWIVRTKELKASASLRVLRERYGVEFPSAPRAAELASQPYWRKFLEERKRDSWVSQCVSHAPELARIIGAHHVRMEMQDHFGVECAPPEIVSRVVADYRGVIEAGGNKIGVSPDVVAVAKSPKLKSEIESYVSAARTNQTSIRKYLEMFLDACGGDIPLTEISVEHYRKYVAAVDAVPTWSETSRVYIIRTVASFLKQLETLHSGLNFRFVKAKEFRRIMPDGKKTQWTWEQVRLAIQHATGSNRTMLLMGLNCGAYISDICALKPEMFDGTHIRYVRQKNLNDPIKGTKFEGCWKVWPETAEALQYSLSLKTTERTFKSFRDEHGLPEQSDLRKTAVQWIEDHVGQTEARLFRSENVGGTHGKNYIKFSDAQRAKLDAALTRLRAFIFGE